MENKTNELTLDREGMLLFKTALEVTIQEIDHVERMVTSMSEEHFNLREQSKKTLKKLKLAGVNERWFKDE